MSLQAEIQAEINRALREAAGVAAGATNATLVQRTPGAYDTATGSVIVTEGSYDCLYVEVGAGQTPAEGMADPAKPRVILSIPGGAVPRDNDRLEIGETAFIIVSVQPQVIGGAVSYVCDLRR